MTLQQTLASAHAQLQAIGIASSWLDAEILLAHTLNAPREYLTSHPEAQLDDKTIKQFSRFVDRRSGGEPVAYIIGEKEFYGLKFKVTPDVLIPRPATEELIETIIQTLSKSSPVVPTKKRLAGRVGTVSAKRKNEPESRAAVSSQGKLTASFFGDNKKIIIDIGTGSGCIAVTLAKHLPNAHIIATDISDKALAIARENAQIHGVADRTTFLNGDLLGPLIICHPVLDTGSRNKNKKTSINEFGNWKLEIGNSPLIVVANLPYVPTSTVESKPELQYEPQTALDGGPEGTLPYRRLFRQLTAYGLRLTIQMVALEIEPEILNPLLSAPELLPFAEHYTITHTPHTFLLTRKIKSI